MKRNFTRLLLSAVLMMCCTQLFAAVGDTFKDDDFTYKITSEDDHTVEVAQNYSAKYSGRVYIEDNVQYNNTTYSVTSIGEQGFWGADLEEVVIPASITSIGYRAFKECRYLTSVEFTDNSQLKTIGESAFEYCKGLHSLEIPASVTSIGKSAFEFCDFLTDVTFAYGSQLETIGENAFYKCKNLHSLAIPTSVSAIGKSAFESCEFLTDVTFADGSQPETIGENTFYNCKNLHSLVIPASVTSIGKSAFYGCTNLTSVTFADGSQLTTIGKSAFSNCSGLTSVTIPSGVTAIGERAFNNCQMLTSITIPQKVNLINDYTFWNCKGLTAVTFADGSQLTTIGESAFSNCSGLTSVTIPSSVTTINEYAFYLCEGLKFVEFKGNTNISGTYVFSNCGTNGWLVNLILPDNWTGSTPGDDGSWYCGLFKSYRPSEYKQAALDAITAAMGEYKNSTYLQGLVATEINAINATTDIATITTQKDAAIAKTQAVVAAYPSIIAEGVEKGKAEAFGELGTEKTGTAVKVTKDDKEIILYAPDKVEYIITK